MSNPDVTKISLEKFSAQMEKMQQSIERMQKSVDDFRDKMEALREQGYYSDWRTGAEDDEYYEDEYDDYRITQGTGHLSNSFKARMADVDDVFSGEWLWGVFPGPMPDGHDFPEQKPFGIAECSFEQIKTSGGVSFRANTKPVELNVPGGFATAEFIALWRTQNKRMYIILPIHQKVMDGNTLSLNCNPEIEM